MNYSNTTLLYCNGLQAAEAAVLGTVPTVGRCVDAALTSPSPWAAVQSARDVLWELA